MDQHQHADQFLLGTHVVQGDDQTHVQVEVDLGHQLLVLDRLAFAPDAHNLALQRVFRVLVGGYPVTGHIVVVHLQPLLRRVQQRLLFEGLEGSEVEVDTVHCPECEGLVALVEAALDDVLKHV